MRWHAVPCGAMAINQFQPYLTSVRYCTKFLPCLPSVGPRKGPAPSSSSGLGGAVPRSHPPLALTSERYAAAWAKQFTC